MSTSPLERVPAGADFALASGPKWRNASAVVADQLRREIEQGTLPPGTRLRQNHLAQRFGLSSTPIREALALLSSQGLIQNDPNKGAVVFHPSLQDFEDAFSIRMVLEPLAIGLATPRLTIEEADSLDALIAFMRRLDDSAMWVDKNDEFHMRLYQASGNPKLTETIEALRSASRYHIHMFVAQCGEPEGANDEHAAILAACRNREPREAKSLLRSHLRKTLVGVMADASATTPAPTR